MAALGNRAVVQQAEALAQRGAVGQAFRLLMTAADGGDAWAAVRLAEWRMAGDVIRRDLGEARKYFGHAAQLGLEAAAPVHIALLASGAGGTGRDWLRALDLLSVRAKNHPQARRQRDLLARMAIDKQGDPLTIVPSIMQHEHPRIDRLAGFMTLAECRYLIDLAVPLLQPSVVIHPRTGKFVVDPVRNARSAAFPFMIEDPVLHALNRRIAAATGTLYDQGEPLQVLCYDPGDEYKLHSDALTNELNQRTQTFLVALNEGYDGGETEFPRAGVRLRGKPGDALCFQNIAPDGRPDDLAWHAGLPVSRGRKLILSKWIRAGSLDISGPPGRPF